MSTGPFDFVVSLAPGVVGYTVDVGPDLYVPLIEASKPGSGDVGRYLDSLPRDRRVVVPNVISARLEGMLARRGFSATVEWAADFEEYVEIWERRP